jgi:hypothetical protein
MSIPPDIEPAFGVEELHRALRDLREPAKLSHSPLVRSALVARQLRSRPGLPVADAVGVALRDGLALLDREAPALANLLRGRFWEGQAVQEMLRAERPERQSERRFFEQQSCAIERLAALLAEQEHSCHQEQPQAGLLARLPIPSYERLFGVERPTAQVVEQLGDPQRYPIISIKGIGGIGKTALADHALRTFLAADNTLHDLVWISAKQESLSGAGINGRRSSIRLELIFNELGQKVGINEILRLPLAQKVERLASVLRRDRYLVVLDNLETVEDFCELAPWLARLATPTQFLLTTRELVPALTKVSQIDLDELDKTAALALIEFMATERGVAGFAPQDLYQLVGGNPLAILLVVSQMHFLPPHVVLEGVRTGSTEEMYRYIFWNAWSVLGEAAREVLFVIQRAGDEADWSWLAMATDWPPGALEQALRQLYALSLVQPQRDPEGQPLYTIHRLTSTFLYTEVLGWK